ncbi:HSP20-like chaperone [Terfezia boudieri ATCC MYA-4762]|uniref:HSP20-like chaperone n=1 Tax=Terfezia boudieri ATCC MYA-4762 TaxID=1051890 RepID=A0A3N4LK51_9PEZI|nr:HSP20-like chaperone [Terfezia boudieri ATCC MYA-4762]
MPFYTRHPFDTLLLSDPFFSSLFSPSTQSRSESLIERGERRDESGIRAFSPNFDVHETPKEYVLDGELPGLDKSNLSIEFTDTNTLVIHGKIERTYTSGTPPGKLLEGGKQKQTITEGKEGKEGKEGEKTKSKSEGEEEPIKYWVSERTVGSFQRSFNFPGEVDQDNVKANYENGILRIVVPKREKRAAKRIDIH